MKTLFSLYKKFGVLFASFILVLISAFAITSVPTTGDYATDQPQYFVQNPTQDTLQQINNILCVIKKTSFEDMVNQGQYVALVDQNTCSTSSNNTSSTSSVSNTPSMMRFVVNATQEINQPIQVKMWAVMPPNNNGGGGGDSFNTLIKGTLSLTSGKTNTNPYGVFTMNFAGYQLDNDGVAGNTAMMKGYIISSSNPDGSGSLKFYEQDPGSTKTVSMNSNGTSSGYAKVQANMSAGGNGGQTRNMSYSVAFNDTLSYIKPDNGSGICYDRNSFNNLVYSYGIYDNSGNRVNLNSGYPVIYKGMQTWIGYFGLGVPPGTNITDGDPITLIENNNTQIPGTLFVRNGRMQQMLAENMTLAKLSGTQFNVYSGQMNVNDVLTWNKDLQAFQKIGSQTCNANGCNQNMLDTPITITQQALEAYANGWGGNGCNPNISLWINGLGGGGSTQISIGNTAYLNNTCTLNYVAPTNSTTLTVWKTNPVVPSNSTTLDLYCMYNCPVDSLGTTINPEFMGGGNDDSGHLAHYVFDPLNYTLAYNGSIISPTESNVNIFSGPLITATQVTALKNGMYSYDGYAHSYSIYSTNAISFYYNFNASGSSQPWNKFTGVTVNGTLVSFDPPLQLIYTNSTGGNVFLQYFGFGNLQGIPGVCKNAQGTVVTCSGGGDPENFTMWVPAYNIPNDSQLTDANNSNTTYWVKQLSIGQQMNLSSGCDIALTSSINLANALSLDTSGSSWINPGTILGDMPNITTSPLYINGVKQP